MKLRKKVSIRSSGRDEYWLQDLIYENPSILGLGSGELIPLAKEKKQSSGGRLDILLKDTQDNSMYEIEVMLGETDPSHIIRTIEYWDIEKRRYPNRQHFPVLIAESFDRRYFNVIQILSLSIPMIAILAQLEELDGQLSINFTKIIDLYEEIAEEEPELPQVTESTWQETASWTLQNAKFFLAIVNREDEPLKLNFTKIYVSLVNNNSENAYWLRKGSKPNSYLGFRVRDEIKANLIKEKLDKLLISYSINKNKEFSITIDSKFIETHKEIILEIHEIRFPIKTTNTSEVI